jgi:hypothetical protein
MTRMMSDRNFRLFPSRHQHFEFPKRSFGHDDAPESRRRLPRSPDPSPHLPCDRSPVPGDAFDSSIDSLPRFTSPQLPTSRDVRRTERTGHSYPTNAFICRTKDLRSVICSETKRLINQDTRTGLGAVSQREVEIFATGPNCGIRQRMFKMRLISNSFPRSL